MSNLPEGVTNAMIDRFFGADRDDWPTTLECNHESELDALWDLVEGEGINPDTDPRFIALRDGPTEFDDKTAEVRSWSTSWGAECEWTCPVCGHLNYDDYEEER